MLRVPSHFILFLLCRGRNPEQPRSLPILVQWAFPNLYFHQACAEGQVIRTINTNGRAWTAEMPQQMKEPATKADNLSWVTKAPMVEWDYHFPQTVLDSTGIVHTNTRLTVIIITTIEMAIPVAQFRSQSPWGLSLGMTALCHPCILGLKRLHLNNLKTPTFQAFLLNLNFQLFSEPSPICLPSRRWGF